MEESDPVCEPDLIIRGHDPKGKGEPDYLDSQSDSVLDFPVSAVFLVHERGAALVKADATVRAVSRRSY